MSAPAHSRSPLGAFIRASSLHIGAAAATASLREELVRDHGLTPRDIDAAYAVSRVTPGTNLLALYALLGHRLGGWRLALQAIAVGSLVPASVAVLVAFLYSRSTSPLIADVMAGARAGGVAVFLGAAVRLLRPQLTTHPRMGSVFALAALLGAWLLPLNLFAVSRYRRHGWCRLASSSMTALALYWLFLRVVLLSFSGFATVPLLREALVLDRGILTDTQLNDAIAISQSSPGPLGLYVVVVGQFVAGLPGALAGVMALATPAVLAIPISRLVLQGQCGNSTGRLQRHRDRVLWAHGDDRASTGTSGDARAMARRAHHRRDAWCSPSRRSNPFGSSPSRRCWVWCLDTCECRPVAELPDREEPRRRNRSIVRDSPLTAALAYITLTQPRFETRRPCATTQEHVQTVGHPRPKPHHRSPLVARR